MKLRLLILFCCMSFTLMTSAQASGGQIRRPNRTQHSSAKPSHSQKPKTEPIVDKRPRNIYTKVNNTVGDKRWILLEIQVRDNGTFFYWSVSSPENSTINYNDLIVIDNTTKERFSILEIKGIDARNNQIDVIKDCPATFTLVYPALPKGASSIDIYKGSSLLFKDIDVSNDISKENLKESSKERMIQLGI